MSSRSKLQWVLRGLVFLVFGVPSAQAWEIHEFYKGARAMAMGGTGVATAEGEEGLFYNPASQAGNRGFMFQYAGLNLATSTDTITTAKDASTAFKNFNTNSLNTLLGKNIYAEGEVDAALTLPHFGISYIATSEVSFVGQNQALPHMELGYMTTNGLQAAYAFSLGQGKRDRNEWRFGVGAKYLFRRGGYHLLSLSDIMTANVQKLRDMTGPYGSAIGMDLGTQYLRHVGRGVTLIGGLSYMNIGDLNFGEGPQPIKGNLTAGIAAKFELSKLYATVAYDYRHITDEADWRKKQHLGVEFGLPMVSLYAGINEVFFTYGASFDAWIIRVTALSYTEELGSFVHQNPEQRYMLRLAMKIDF